MDLQRKIIECLTGCNSVLDLCAGSGHWLENFKAIKVGWELNEKYKSALENNGYSFVYIEDIKRIRKDDFYLFDATMLIDAIEHIEENEALRILELAEKYTKRVIVFTPNEFQDNKHNANALGEPLQEHKSVFPKEFWINRGYSVVLETYNSQDKVHNNLYMKRFEKNE